MNDKICKLGNKEHRESVQILLDYAADVIKEEENKAPYYAYMYGVICHFCLDAYCHGFVNGNVADYGIAHNLQEAEFDRYLMELDGYNPLKFKPANTLKNEDDAENVIAKVSPELTPRIVRAAIRRMRKWLNFYIAPHKITRGIIYGAMWITGNYKSKNGMIMKYKKQESCTEIVDELMRLYEKSLNLAYLVITDYADNVEGGLPYRKAVTYNFSPQRSIERDLDNGILR